MSIFEKVFGTHSEKEIKRIMPLVEKIEALDESMQKLSDDELKAKTDEFKKRLNDGETLDDLLVEAFAVVREAASRVLGMKHYEVQLMGGILLHQGRIPEMRTGEGKTLVSTLPAYLNALEGKGVHIVTVNDYLAKRDAEWMGQIHEFLGLKVGVILNSYNKDERREAYNCDITYVTNNELGFDYLRDNMAIYKEQLVQRSLHYAIVDEVDSVLIDEARTPLIISGQSGKSTELYRMCDYLARSMKRGQGDGELSKMDAIMGVDIEEDGDFLVNEKDKQVMLTAQGVKAVEQFFKSIRDNAGSFIFADEMNNNGTLVGYPYKTTNLIETTGGKTSIVFGNWNDLIIGEQGALEIETSREGAWTDDNGNLVSAFENDQTLVRAIDNVDIGLRHDESFAVATKVAVPV